MAKRTARERKKADGPEKRVDARHLRPPELEGAELSYIRTWSGAAAPDVRPCAEIILVDAADKVILHRGETQVIRTGLVGIRTPYETGKLVKRHDDETRVRLLSLSDEQLRAAADEVGARFEDLPSTLVYRDEPRLMAATSALFGAFEQHAGALELQTRVATCATELLRALTAKAPQPRRSAGHATAARIRDILHDRLAEDLPLDELARETGVTRSHVVHSFRNSFGVTPYVYLMHLRVARARTLLARGERAIDVAHACGFYDQSHLNRWFRKTVGVTPTEYATSVSALLARPSQRGPSGGGADSC